MALDKISLINSLTSIFSDLDENNTASSKANQLANVIDTYVRSATVVVNTGIPVQVAFPAGTGSTISPGSGTLT